MKRDWDLIRSLLLEIEEKTPEKILSTSDFKGDTKTIGYHLTLLIEAGLVKGLDTGILHSRFSCKIFRLSWSGHDFLDAISNDNVWTKTKESVKGIGGKITFETIKCIAVKYMSTLIT